MVRTAGYASPLGDILLAADETGLTGLWFCGAKYFAAGLDRDCEPGSLPALDEARRWLDLYFRGERPEFTPALHLKGSAFCRDVWQLLPDIPYGETTTYGALARTLAKQRGLAHMSAQAVGGAVGRNPVSLIVPCHRVVGANGSLTGYAGGVEKKRALLQLEGLDLTGSLRGPQYGKLSE